MNKVHAASPEGWVLRGLTFGSYHGVVLRVDPDLALEQTLLVALGSDIDDVGHSIAQQSSSRHTEFVVFRTQPGRAAYLRGGCFCLRVEHLLQNMLLGCLPTLHADNLKVLRFVRVAFYAYKHFCVLVHAIVFENI